MESILEAVGHTPVVELRRSVPAGGARVYAKLERFNPGGSLKDRVVLAILTKAEKSGRLKKGSMIAAGTTGNSGIALGWIGNLKGYRVILTMPENYSLERRRMLEAYGVHVHITPAAEGMKGAIRRAREIAEKENGFFFNQFEDPETVKIHEETTAQEIEAAIAGPIAAFVACVGTGGSLSGVGAILKKKGTKVVAVEPASFPHKIQGTGVGFVPPILKKDLIDQTIAVGDREAFETAREIARKEGILAGISSGAAFSAARKVARNLGPNRTVVTIFPDSGERYFSLSKYF